MNSQNFPEPRLEMAIEPKSKDDQGKLTDALVRLAEKDPSFTFAIDDLTGQIVIKGMDELHLDFKVDILRRTYKVDVNAGAPQVAYRETISRKFTEDYTHKKQSGGSGQFARVIIDFEPLPPGSGYEFESKIVGDAVPKEYIPGVEKGLEAQKDTGVIAGFPTIDFKATLVDGAYHDVDSSALAFEIAARAAFREGIPKAGPTLLEPIMKVEVVTPEEFMGYVIGDLFSRRGQIQGMDQRGNARTVDAYVPLSNMFGYYNTLRTMTQKRGSFEMNYYRYEPVPTPPSDDDPRFRPAMGMRA
jgi:elongation factor G